MATGKLVYDILLANVPVSQKHSGEAQREVVAFAERRVTMADRLRRYGNRP